MIGQIGCYFLAHVGFRPNSFINAANGPKLCPTYAYLHAHILGLGVSTTLRYQRLGDLKWHATYAKNREQKNHLDVKPDEGWS